MEVQRVSIRGASAVVLEFISAVLLYVLRQPEPFDEFPQTRCCPILFPHSQTKNKWNAERWEGFYDGCSRIPGYRGSRTNVDAI